MRARRPAPRKTKTWAPPGLLPKPQGHLRGFPFTASGSRAAAGQPPEQTRSPKSEFQFSSATRRVHFPPPRPRGERTRESEGGGSRRLGPGPGSPQHPAARTQEKKKAREHRGLIKAKTQDHPLGSTNNPRQGFARNKQALQRNYNEKKSPLRVIVKSPRRWSAKGTAVFQDTACAKIHHAQSGTSCPDFS